MRIRFKLRTVMIIVAMLAIVLVAERVRRRYSYCRGKAAVFAASEAQMSGLAVKREIDAAFIKQKMDESRAMAEELDLDERRNLEEFADSCGSAIQLINSEARHLRSKAAYYAKLKEKYHHLSTRPWLTMEPDPPPPTLELATP